MRWDGDTRGRGVGDAASSADGAEELVEAMRTREWVAEEPELHLLPHLRAACERLPLELEDARTAADGSYEVDLAWRGAEPGLGEVRRAVFELIGGIAETATYVRQRVPNGAGDGRVVFELVTGLIDSDMPFAPHGHAVYFSVKL
jgi:hypothetical protein